MTTSEHKNAVKEWFDDVMDDYHEPWRMAVATEVAQRILDTIPEPERTPTLITAIGETALVSLGLKPLPEERQGEQ